VTVKEVLKIGFKMAARRFAVFSALASTAFAAVITDYACYTGSSLYER
jgi:hypothetical protein